MQDSLPEIDESFWVNLTSVQLIGSQAAEGAAPSVRRPGDIATVTITENDDAQGIVQFNVARVGLIYTTPDILSISRFFYVQIPVFNTVKTIYGNVINERLETFY